MVWYTYGTTAVYDPISDEVKENAVGGKLVAVKDGAAIPIRDLNGNPIASVTSNANGMSSQFQAEVPYGLMQFGDVVVTVFANEVPGLANAAAAAQAAAEAALAALQAFVASTPGLNLEALQDAVAAMVVPGTNITKLYDDTAGTLTLSATPGSALDIEGVQDAVGAMVVGGSGITKVYDDNAGTLTITATSAAPSLATLPSAYLQIHVPYSVAYAAASRSAFLSSIGASGKTDYRINVYGQTVTVNAATGQITAQDPAVPWLLDPLDTAEIGPSA